jgi:hypothetical protein
MPPLSSLILFPIGALNLLNGLANLASAALRAKNGRVMGIDSLPALDAIALGSASVG